MSVKTSLLLLLATPASAFAAECFDIVEGGCCALSLLQAQSSILRAREFSDAAPSIDGLPPLRWLNEQSGEAQVNSDGVLTLRAQADTDWFNPPEKDWGPKKDSPALLFTPPVGDWQLSSKVFVAHNNPWEAGALFLYQGDEDWSKITFELSETHQRVVESVITKEVSDDVEGPAIEGSSLWLRIAKDGNSISFHYSLTTGDTWQFFRSYTPRDAARPISVGFLTQAPGNDGCAAQFSQIKLRES